MITTQSSPATAALPVTRATTLERDRDRRRNPWIWPVVILAVLLVAAGVAIAMMLLNQQQQPPVDSGTPVPSQTLETVDIDLSDFEGMDEAEFRAAIEALELEPAVETGNPATAEADAGTVYAVDPTGPVPVGSTVTGTIYAPVAAIADPTSVPRLQDGGDPAALTVGDSPVVVWDEASCPAGYSLGGYTTTITWPDGREQIEETGIAQMNFSSVPAGDTTISYTYTCDVDGGESLTSGSSPALTMTATPEETPEPEPTPTPTPTEPTETLPVEPPVEP